MPSITVLVNSRVPGYTAKALGMIEAATSKAVFDIEGRAKGRSPVDTGNLKNSIQGSMTGRTEGRVDAGAEYAVYVEFGTYKMGALPYLIPATEEVVPSFKAAIAAAVR